MDKATIAVIALLAVVFIVLIIVLMSLKKQNTALRELSAQKNEAEMLKELQILNRQLDHDAKGSREQLDNLQKALATEFYRLRQTTDGQLSEVNKGLGEMQSLTARIGELQKLLSNVKLRGTWGEVQLGGILQELLYSEQYAANVAIEPLAAERVDYALRIPGEDGFTWLPIDAKCPLEDYERLCDAELSGDKAAAESAGRALAKRLEQEAASIRQKYIKPPHSTDFALMFLPLEGLYNAALAIPGLAEKLQKEHRVVLAGPGTLGALINILQLGYKNLALNEQAAEIRAQLSLMQREFAAFDEQLAKNRKKLTEALNAQETLERRYRVMMKKLDTLTGESAPLAGKLQDDVE